MEVRKLDLFYGPLDSNKMELYLGEFTHKAPVVLYIHGGRFTDGSLKDIISEDMQGALDNGMAYATIDYPLVPEATLDETMKHIAMAIQYLKYHAEAYGLDKNKIAISGSSAGATVCLYLATSKDYKDLAAADPVLQESSKPCCIGLYDPQATYDCSKWMSLLADKIKNLENTLQGAINELNRLYGTQIESLEKVSEFAQVLNQFDMCRKINAETVPVFVKSFVKETDQQDYLHHPAHSQEIIRYCKAYGVPYEEHYAGDQTRWFYQFAKEQISK